MTGQERADKVRRKLYSDEAAELLPEGSVVFVTPDEAADWLREQGWVPLTAEEAEEILIRSSWIPADHRQHVIRLLRRGEAG